MQKKNSDVNKYIKSLIQSEYTSKQYKKKELDSAIGAILDRLEESEHDYDEIEIKKTIRAKYTSYSKEDKRWMFSVKNTLTKKKVDKKPIKKTKKKSKPGRKVKSAFVFVDDTDSEPEEEVTEEQMKKLHKQLDLISSGRKLNSDGEAYEFPIESPYEKIKPTSQIYGPYGTQWLHDEQVDDEYDDILHARAKQYDKLRAIKLPEQRSDEWFAMREQRITASDGGTILGVNKHSPQFEFIYKKVFGRPFKSNEPCYHGTKLEEIATMIYQYRMNVTVDEFGLMGHPNYYFIGASPDGICNRYKLDGKTRSKYVGRMLEIKCPIWRRINTSGEIKDHICPIYYWVQVQLQLERCALEECDFWQCKLSEYKSRKDFINDTDKKEPFKSISSGREKGCLIQLLPYECVDNFLKDRKQGVYDNSKFIYPPKIEMTPYECDQWVAETIANFPQHPTFGRKYFVDRIIYWKLEMSHNVTIKRDREWFADSLPKLRKMWSYVEFLRENEEIAKLVKRYIDSRKRKSNDDIMNVIKNLCNPKMDEYKSYIKKITKIVELDEKQNNEMEKKIRVDLPAGAEYADSEEMKFDFVNSDDSSSEDESQSNDSDSDSESDDGCLFVD